MTLGQVCVFALTLSSSIPLSWSSLSSRVLSLPGMTRDKYPQPGSYPPRKKELHGCLANRKLDFSWKYSVRQTMEAVLSHLIPGQRWIFHLYTDHAKMVPRYSEHAAPSIDEPAKTAATFALSLTASARSKPRCHRWKNCYCVHGSSVQRAPHCHRGSLQDSYFISTSLWWVFQLWYCLNLSLLGAGLSCVRLVAVDDLWQSLSVRFVSLWWRKSLGFDRFAGGSRHHP